MPLTSSLPPASRLAAPLAGLAWIALLGVPALALFSAPAGLRFDGLALATSSLTLFVAAIAMTFSLRYMRTDPRQARFYVTVSLLVASVLCFVLASNLLVFAAAWCASGWLLARLIGHGTGWSEASAAARRTRLTFALGDAAMLAALALLGFHAGSADLDAALAHLPTMHPAVISAAALCLVAAAAARCALPPFSNWLLSSMTAPTPVSALMHAGLVNAGGFLLIRFAPVLEAAPTARVAALGLGLFAAVYGIGIMIVRPDIKRSLAGSTISQMGFMIMSCGLGAYAAALWHIVAHGLFKAWLFLGSGSAVGMKTGEQSFAGQWRVTAAAAAVALVAGAVLALSRTANAGLVPLLLGMTTATVALAGSLGSALPARSKLWLASLIVALGAFQAVGFTLAKAAVGPDGPILLSSAGIVAVLAAILCAWVWQSKRLAEGAALPPAIYVHLLNAGALRAAGTGEAK